MNDEQPPALPQYITKQEFELRSLYSQPIDFDQMLQLITDAAKHYRPVETFKLTQKQCDELLATVPTVRGDSGTYNTLLGVPLEIVENVRDSTPYKRWLAKVEAEYAVPFPMPWLPFGPTTTEGGKPALP